MRPATGPAGYDGGVDDERTTDGRGDASPGPGEHRPERQLDRPPSDRYWDPEPLPEGDASRAPRWGIAAAGLTALLGALAIAIAGGKLTITAGLLVVAAVLGWLVAGLVSMDAAPTSGRTGRRTVATVIALAVVNRSLRCLADQVALIVSPPPLTTGSVHLHRASLKAPWFSSPQCESNVSCGL